MKTQLIEERLRSLQLQKEDAKLLFSLLHRDLWNQYSFALSRLKNLEEEMFILALETEEEK